MPSGQQLVQNLEGGHRQQPQNRREKDESDAPLLASAFPAKRLHREDDQAREQQDRADGSGHLLEQQRERGLRVHGQVAKDRRAHQQGEEQRGQVDEQPQPEGSRAPLGEQDEKVQPDRREEEREEVALELEQTRAGTGWDARIEGDEGAHEQGQDEEQPRQRVASPGVDPEAYEEHENRGQGSQRPVEAAVEGGPLESKHPLDALPVAHQLHGHRTAPGRGGEAAEGGVIPSEHLAVDVQQAIAGLQRGHGARRSVLMGEYLKVSEAEGEVWTGPTLVEPCQGQDDHRRDGGYGEDPSR